LEEIFQLVYHCHIDYETAENMPVFIRKWWLKRTVKEISQKKGDEPQPLKKGLPGKK